MEAPLPSQHQAAHRAKNPAAKYEVPTCLSSKATHDPNHKTYRGLESQELMGHIYCPLFKNSKTQTLFLELLLLHSRASVGLPHLNSCLSLHSLLTGGFCLTPPGPAKPTKDLRAFNPWSLANALLCGLACTQHWPPLTSPSWKLQKLLVFSPRPLLLSLCCRHLLPLTVLLETPNRLFLRIPRPQPDASFSHWSLSSP